jgi:hypothetical protein
VGRSFEKEQCMQRFPPGSPRTREHRTREPKLLRETEERRDHEEHDATRDWLDHLAAGRIAVK